MKRPLLLPLVPLYAAGLAFRDISLRLSWQRTRILWYPVISIGNLSTGGSGKTPLTISLARLLAAEGFHVDVLSRGYGRKAKEPSRVDPIGSAEQFGDEPLLIAREAGVPVYVAPERYDAGNLADQDFIKQGGELSADPVPLVHLLDDGFQHRQLFRDIDILLMNREDWHDHLLPAGNLREPVDAAERASVLVIADDDSAFEQELYDSGWSGPVWRIRRRMEVPQIESPVAAFCGLARPEQFFRGLEANGMKVVLRRAFRDHHPYTMQDARNLVASAQRAGAATLITTEKDIVRLGGLTSVLSGAVSLEVARLRIEFDDRQSVAAWLKKRLSETHLARSHRETVRKHPPC